MRTFEHATLEWLWTPPDEMPDMEPQFTIVYPDGKVETRTGSNVEVTQALTELGKKGFEALTSVAAGNWILWTLKRRVPPKK